MASPIYKLGETCEHGALKRQCEICHRDADIAELKHDISRALETNTALLKENEALRAKLAEAEKDAAHWQRMFECAQNANAHRQAAIDAELAK